MGTLPAASRGYRSGVRSSTTSARRPFTTLPSSPALLDGAIAGVTLLGSLALIAHGGVIPASPWAGQLDMTGVVLASCSTVPLIAWRRFPLGVFAVTGATGVLMAALGYPVDLLPGPTAALYLLVTTREPKTPWTRGTAAAVAGMFVAHLGAAAVAGGTFPGTELFHTGLAWSAAWFAGERTRLRRDHLAELRQRALRAERDADRERLLAIAEERARIARDLHDSAGHAISVIAVRAGAARLRHDPARSLAALEAIEELARQTAAEMDQIVGNLRAAATADEPVEAPAGLASLDTLIAHHACAGLGASVEVSGTPRSLGRAADQASYRILQEALTNAARHGTGSARIELAFDDTAVMLTVTNPVLADAAARPAGGHGLTGMRERATLLDGSVDSERANGAFRVRARIPYGGHQR